MNLSQMLSEGTRTAHQAVEKTPFLQTFFTGRIRIDAYRAFLARLYQLYVVLETYQQQYRDHIVVGRLYYPQLFRARPLAQDLAYYYGSQWLDHLPLKGAMCVYVEHLHHVARTWPEGLVAHHYTRYLGDLSGGQVLKRLVTKVFGLPPDEGVAFYTFDEILDTTQFKIAYRTQLDTLPINADTALNLVKEANCAFDLHLRLFQELEALCSQEKDLREESSKHESASAV